MTKDLYDKLMVFGNDQEPFLTHNFMRTTDLDDGTATVTLSASGRKLFSEEMPMAQFGTVFGLAPSLFTSKKEPSYATFDPATGALREIGEVKE